MSLLFENSNDISDAAANEFNELQIYAAECI